MIKRQGALLLTLLYTVTVMGFVLNLHYCFSDVTSVRLDNPVKSCNVNAAGKMKCCHDKRIEVKINDAHRASTSFFISKLVGFESVSVPFIHFFFPLPNGGSGNDTDHSPPVPPSNQLLIFIKNCIFRM